MKENQKNNGQLPKISREEFSNLSAEWQVLNNKYDGFVQKLFNNPDVSAFALEQMSEFKEMQGRLFELETRLFRIATGEEVLE